MGRKVFAPSRSAPKQTAVVDNPESLPVPNHLNSLRLPKLGTGTEDGLCYSIICLAIGETEDSGAPYTLAFVDPRHNCQSWVHRQVFDDLCGGCQQRLHKRFLGTQPPPTWMDPEVFVRQILADEDFRRLVIDAITQPQKLPALERALQTQLETRYFEYLRKRFETVKKTLARWLVAYWARRSTP